MDTTRTEARTYHDADGAPHHYCIDTDRCVCGGEWVYLEPERTHGCFEGGTPPEGMVLDGNGRRVDNEEAGAW